MARNEQTFMPELTHTQLPDLVLMGAIFPQKMGSPSPSMLNPTINWQERSSAIHDPEGGVFVWGGVGTDHELVRFYDGIVVVGAIP